MNILQPETDHLAIFEQRIRTSGVWCDVSVKDRIAHKFICKHPTATIAISLCGVIIKPFEKLHENTTSRKCLVCALFDTAGKETQERIIPQLTNAIDEQVNQSTT